MIARSITLLVGLVVLTGGTTWGQAPERLAPAQHSRPGATRPPTKPATKPTTRPTTRLTTRPTSRPSARPATTPHVRRPVAKPMLPASNHRLKPKTHGPRFVKKDLPHRHKPVGHGSTPVAQRGLSGSHTAQFTPPPPRRMPPRGGQAQRIPRSFADVFGGAFAGSTGPSGKVQTLDGGGRPRLLGSFRSLSATEIEISMHNGFLLRLILQDFDPATGMAIADTYLVDTAAQPNNPRVWSYKSSGRMQLPVGASPPQGALQTRWTNMGHGLPGGGVSISTPTAPTTLFFVP